MSTVDGDRLTENPPWFTVGFMASKRSGLVRASDVRPRLKVPWLWRYWMQKGTLTILAGLSETGKTTLSLDIASRLTVGKEWPDGQENTNRPTAVMYVSAEGGGDVLKDNVLPRFLNHDGDPDLLFYRNPHKGRVNVFDEESLDLLEEDIRSEGISLVIFDPLPSVMGGADQNKESVVRPALHALDDLCARTNCSALAIKHPSKDTERPMEYRISSGSYAFTSVPRSVLVAQRNPNVPRSLNEFWLYAMITNNGPKPVPQRYKINGGEEAPEHPQVDWISELDVDEALAFTEHQMVAEVSQNGHSRNGHERKELCKVWLSQLVEHWEGEAPIKEAQRLGKEMGFTKQNIRDAVKDLGMEAHGIGDESPGRGVDYFVYRYKEAK